jgi:radical SAM-linked protein
LRAVFEKKGRAKYISHLDLNRCMLRVFRRSKLPIWYTEGFNPHPYISFALALSLGFESSCEIFDFNLNEEMDYNTVRDRLNEVMPEGMRVVSVGEQKKKITEITKAEYEITLTGDEPSGIIADMNSLMQQDEIIIEKKTKKGMKNVDIKPYIEITGIACPDNLLKITVRLPAGTQTNYNPTLILDALKNSYNTSFEVKNICRTGILCENDEKFL